MCRIFFIGSIPEHIPGESKLDIDKCDELCRAGIELGRESVRRGHKLILGSDSINTIDKYVMDGVFEYCKDSQNKAYVEIHRPQNSRAIYTDVPDNVEISRVDYDSDTESKLKWIVSHVRALDSCDVVILLGGGASTKLIGNIAADRQIPVLAVPNFGGSAENVYEKLKYYYRNLFSDNSDISVLTQSWNTSSAEKIVGLAETIRSKKRGREKHSYFISYSWSDMGESDHLEIVLLRNHRIVNRDERSLNPGEDLDDGVRLLIEESDTFIGLYSENFKNSSWCPSELAYAQRRNQNGKNPKRIVLISLDGTDVPITYEGKLKLLGGSRSERELSVLRLIREET